MLKRFQGQTSAGSSTHPSAPKQRRTLPDSQLTFYTNDTSEKLLGFGFTTTDIERLNYVSTTGKTVATLLKHVELLKNHYHYSCEQLVGIAARTGGASSLDALTETHENLILCYNREEIVRAASHSSGYSNLKSLARCSLSLMAAGYSKNIILDTVCCNGGGAKLDEILAKIPPQVLGQSLTMPLPHAEEHSLPPMAQSNNLVDSQTADNKAPIESLTTAQPLMRFPSTLSISSPGIMAPDFDAFLSTILNSPMPPPAHCKDNHHLISSYRALLTLP